MTTAEKKRQKIRIRLKCYDQRVLDRSAQDIVETAKRTGARVAGPIPLPTKREIYTVLRSPNIDRNSRAHPNLRLASAAASLHDNRFAVFIDIRTK